MERGRKLREKAYARPTRRMKSARNWLEAIENESSVEKTLLREAAQLLTDVHPGEVQIRTEAWALADPSTTANLQSQNAHRPHTFQQLPFEAALFLKIEKAMICNSNPLPSLTLRICPSRAKVCKKKNGQGLQAWASDASLLLRKTA